MTSIHAAEVVRAASAEESALQSALRRSIFEKANSAAFRRQMLRNAPRSPEAPALAVPVASPTPSSSPTGPSIWASSSPAGKIVWLGPDGGAGRLRTTPFRGTPPEQQKVASDLLVVVPVGGGARSLPPPALLGRLMIKPKLLLATAEARQAGAASRRAIHAALRRVFAQRHAALVAIAASRRAAVLEMSKARHEARANAATARACAALGDKVDKARAMGTTRAAAAACNRACARMALMELSIHKEARRLLADRRRAVAVASESTWRKAKWAAAAVRRLAADAALRRRGEVWTERELKAASRRKILLLHRAGRRTVGSVSPHESGVSLALSLRIEAAPSVPFVLLVRCGTKAQALPSRAIMPVVGGEPEKLEKVTAACAPLDKKIDREILSGFALSGANLEIDDIEARVRAQNEAKDREARARAKWYELSKRQAVAAAAGTHNDAEQNEEQDWEIV